MGETMRIPGSARIVLAVALAATIVPLASCGGSGPPSREKLITWPLDTVSAVHVPVSASKGGKATVTTAAMTAEVEFPPGALSEDMEIELLPMTGPPVKDGAVNLADGVFIRRMGDGVNTPPTLAKPAELRFTVKKPAPAGTTILRWSLSKGTAEPIQTTILAQGSATVLSASISVMGGYGARAPQTQK
jgi:hypothetical protein